MKLTMNSKIFASLLFGLKSMIYSNFFLLKEIHFDVLYRCDIYSYGIIIWELSTMQ